MAKRVIEFPVPLALRKIFLERGSGELLVRGDSFEKTLFFLEGRLSYARTTVMQERLGEILFKIGKINREQFVELQRLLDNQKDKIGRLLVQHNFINQRDLFFALIFQIRTIAVSTFLLGSGEWDFVAKTPDLPPDSRFAIEMPAIFNEGVGRYRNLGLFKSNHQHMVPRTKPIPEEMRDFISGEDASFFHTLAGLGQLNAAQAAAKSGLGEEKYWNRLLFFYLLGVVEFQESPVEKEVNRNIEDLITLCEEIRQAGGEVDYYHLFGLQNDASFNEIRDAYFRMAKKFHPDRLSGAPDPDLREKANFVFTRINQAYDVLSNEERRREYDTHGYKEVGARGKVTENLQEKANILYRKANTLYMQQKYWEAASLMDEAVRLDAGKPSYFLLLGLCQSAIPNLKRAAETNLRKAMEADPHNTEPLVALGMLYLSEQMGKRAEGFFRKALSLNPDHKLARRKLAELVPDEGGKQSLLGFLGKKK